ncbi:hypothetical protein [Leisingera sp. McT4-56]|uniref:hypothetical protein n=1 Tax=Leisingera sp. McT4-56 TaxID=2881255 RepID=UPI001CF8EAA5|nr:hypothetical protein [Leisingera sp. McT4-56]MCB4457238.1 hypothetical protein [Leisingera sp. McT4-56]
MRQEKPGRRPSGRDTGRSSFRALIKDAIKPYPALFAPVFRHFGPKRARGLLIGPETEVVIEGFPRSANTFSVVAFRAAGNRSVKLAHHLHAEAQIVAGVRRGLPTMVLIRAPESAVRSYCVFYEGADENKALRLWISFYRRMLPLQNHIYIADFRRVVSDFGAVTSEFNAAFKTDFACFDHSEENVAAVYAEIEEIARRTHKVAERRIARPSEAKSRAQDAIEYNFDPGLLEQANALYTRLLCDQSSYDAVP